MNRASGVEWSGVNERMRGSKAPGSDFFVLFCFVLFCFFVHHRMSNISPFFLLIEKVLSFPPKMNSHLLPFFFSFFLFDLFVHHQPSAASSACL